MTVQPYLRALAIGATTGLRSMTGPAATARAGASPWTGLLTALAAGEIVADKLPFAPSRLLPPALIGRAVFGGICGGIVAARFSGRRVAGIALGSTAAIVSAWLGYTIRQYLTHDVGLPDFPVGLLEDGITIWGSIAANGALLGG